MSLIRPGATLGILGGGQLGRMLAHAAQRLGYDVAVYDPDPEAPAARVAAWSVCTKWDDLGAIRDFAGRCSAVTYEFENVPAATAAAVEAAGVPLRPGSAVLAISQDRLEEKRFLTERCDIDVAPWRPVDSPADLEAALAALGGAGVLKTRRLGYDGKGQIRLKTGDDPARAFAAIGAVPAILEAVVPFEKEVSCIGARSADGAIALFPLCENRHVEGILARTYAPARVSETVEVAAAGAMRRALHALDYVGVLTIEFFVLDGDIVLGNEIAPRVHNSGHWTLDAAATDQFEQHVRCMTGLPLGDPDGLWRCEMRNLLGEQALAIEALLAEPESRLHLYGKRDPRPGRKMGHITRRITVLPDETP